MASSATERCRPIDSRILDSMEPGVWYTAEELAIRMGRPGVIDPYVIGARCRSLRQRSKVEGRPDRKNPAISVWRKAELAQAPEPERANPRFVISLRHVNGRSLNCLLVTGAATSDEAREQVEREPYVSKVTGVRRIDDPA